MARPTRHWTNVGSMSKTSVQHWSNIGSMSRVYCGRWDDTTSCLFLTPFIGPRHWGRLTVSSPGRSQFFGLGHLSRSCRHLRLFKPRLTALRQCALMLPELRLVVGWHSGSIEATFLKFSWQDGIPAAICLLQTLSDPSSPVIRRGIPEDWC